MSGIEPPLISPIEKTVRKEYRAKVNEARDVFVPAALEYIVRGHSLREVAFFGGYAQLALRPTAWRLPRPGDPLPARGRVPAPPE